jgi:transcriptional regulator with XRE-family HTH domain
LRSLRLAGGLSQAALAERAGLTRQLVAAAEAGRHVPSVDAALRLARVLGVSVEELFAEAPRKWVSLLAEEAREGELVVAARVGDRLAVAPLRAELARGSSWAAADGVVEGGVPRLFGGADPERFVLLGCDPAIGLAEALLSGPGGRRLLAVPATTGAALAALLDGRSHAAVVHGPEGGLPSAPPGLRRFHLARWRVGLATAGTGGAPSLASALATAAPLVQRPPDAASQQALARAAAAIGARVPAGPLAAGHLDAARAVRERGGAAITYEPAARRLELAFLPLETHVVEVWVAERWLEHPGMAALGELLAGRGLRERLAAIGGYELEEIGAERGAA